ncbi:MAG TPA: type II toxin-antitoxin system RelE/ParE family toxin [Hymenobacter sp.]|jgi:plasmid maintenance system killer protein
MLSITLEEPHEPYLEQLFTGRPCADKRFKSNPVLAKQVLKTIAYFRTVANFPALQQIRSLNIETLSGDRKGYWSARINEQYRLIFRTEPTDVEPKAITIIVLTEITNHYD